MKQMELWPATTSSRPFAWVVRRWIIWSMVSPYFPRAASLACVSLDTLTVVEAESSDDFALAKDRNYTSYTDYICFPESQKETEHEVKMSARPPRRRGPGHENRSSRHRGRGSLPSEPHPGGAPGGGVRNEDAEELVHCLRLGDQRAF